MSIKVSKSDVIWSYIAQFFSLGSGLITLPLVLHLLSTEEIAMNYLMMTVAAMVVMVDFGFSPQFGRNFTYVFSGAQRLEKEGLSSKVDSTGQRGQVSVLRTKCGESLLFLYLSGAPVDEARLHSLLIPKTFLFFYFHPTAGMKYY